MIKIFSRAAALMASMLMLLCCCSCGVPSDNTSTGFDSDKLALSGIYDGKGILTDYELDELNELIRETSDKLDLHIFVYISDTFMGESRTAEFADDTYDEIFGKDSDGVFYYMDLAEASYAYDFISTSGKAVLYYEHCLDDLFDHIYNYLPSTGESFDHYQIATAVEEICCIFEKYGKGEPNPLNYYHDVYTDKYVYISGGETIISGHKPFFRMIMASWMLFPIGIAVGLICYFAIKRHYKFKPGYNARAYVSNNETRFNRREDIFLRTHTSRIRIQSSSGGGGGGRSRGGHGRSGGSHGGGGRRR